MIEFVYYLGIGAFAGTLAGLLGVGGGLIIVPLLIALYGHLGFVQEWNTHMAIGTSLGTIVFTSLSSIRTHHRAKKVEWKIVLRLAPGILFGGLLGALFADKLSGLVLQLMFGTFTILVAAKMVLELKPTPIMARLGNARLIGGGIVIGGVSSLFGIGGGTLTVPFLLAARVAMPIAVGCSAACGFPVALSGAAGYIIAGWANEQLPVGALGYVYLPALLGIICSSVFFAHLGASWAHRLPAKQLKQVFALLLVVIGVRFIWIAGHGL